MPLDPQAKRLLEQLATLGFPPVYEVTPAQARANAMAFPRTPGPAVARTFDAAVPAPGGSVPVRVYVPPGTGPFPVLVWYHGGGWVVGGVESDDPTARRLCAGSGCVVVSVDYRLAPEAKFPVAAEDSYAAAVWASKNAAQIGGDARRVAVGGASAGGNLAAAVTLMARDRGGPTLGFQLLVYPVTDYNFETASYRENAAGYGLTTDTMRWYWKQYLRSAGDARNPYAAPLQAQDLRGLPPALVITAEFDPLRDDGEKYAARLKAAGVPVTCTRYDGMIHTFFTAFYRDPFTRLDKAQAAIDEACAALRKAL